MNQWSSSYVATTIGQDNAVGGDADPARAAKPEGQDKGEHRKDQGTMRDNEKNSRKIYFNDPP